MNEASSSHIEFASRYEDAAVRLLALLEAACASCPEWPYGLRRAVSSALFFLASDPALARLLLFEPYEAGPLARARHEETLARIAAMLRAGSEWTEAQEEMPELVEEGLVGGLAFILARPLRRGEPERLPDLGPELTAFLLTPYLGRAQAEHVAADA